MWRAACVGRCRLKSPKSKRYIPVWRYGRRSPHMPRLTNRNPSYRRHRASGQAVVTLNGQDVYLGPHGTAASKREYDRVIGEWLARRRELAHSQDAYNVSML